MGTQRLFAFVDRNPEVELHSFDTILNPSFMAGFDSFVSVNSALQVDLTGQVNAESIDGKQLSGVGGGVDFILGAWLSPGGKTIIALPSVDRKSGKSRIVGRLEAGTTVTVPRHFVQYVVTEHGIADLAGLSVRERAKALIAVADPALLGELEAGVSDGG